MKKIISLEIKCLTENRVAKLINDIFSKNKDIFRLHENLLL